LLVGSNPRIEAPLVNTRIRKMVRHFDLPVASVGRPVDLTYEVEQLGTGADALSALLAGKTPFAATLREAKRPMIIVGTGALLREDGGAISAMARQLAQASGCLVDDWNGFSVLQPTSSAVGALDVGFVPGPTAAPLEALKLVYLMAADHVPADKLDKDAYVIYQGHHGDAGAHMADLVLPGTAYTEKVATYVNTEGRVQRTARAADPPGDSREDWQIVVALSRMMRQPLPYDSLAGLRGRMAEIAPHLNVADGVSVEPSSAGIAAVALDFVQPSAPPSMEPMSSSVTNFYQSDSVSNASSTMAKCVQEFGTRA